ncbi:MAG TPA: amidohydrolase family protein [Nitrospirae bacterium]|nr:amidohydrolase family protein [Nitrospirota bacterium]
MKQADIIICGDYVVTMNEKMDLITKGAIAIKDGRIIDIGQENSIRKNYLSKTLIDGKDKALLPGLINTHTHAAMVYYRGLADDLPLKEWWEQHMFPAETKTLSHEFILDALELACLEMIKSGVTTFNDMYFFGDSAAESTIKSGIRGIIGVGILDFPSVSAKTQEEYFNNVQVLIDKYKGHELITPCISPHALYTCSPETFKKAQEMAEKHDISIHIHLSETEWEVSEILSRYGKRPVNLLHSIGFLSQRVLAAHCVWLNDEEIDLLAQTGTSVSHCLESNMKLASGFAPIVKMIKSGVNVSIGTDGAASNNDLSMIGEMSTVAKVHKAIEKDPTAIDDRTTLKMATINGAKALAMEHLIGSLEKGKYADIVSINLKKPHLTPLYDIYSHIVYSSISSDVDTVIVNGKLLMENGYVLTLDEDEVIKKSNKWVDQISKFKK